MERAKEPECCGKTMVFDKRACEAGGFRCADCGSILNAWTGRVTRDGQPILYRFETMTEDEIEKLRSRVSCTPPRHAPPLPVASVTRLPDYSVSDVHTVFDVAIGAGYPTPRAKAVHAGDVVRTEDGSIGIAMNAASVPGDPLYVVLGSGTQPPRPAAPEDLRISEDMPRDVV